MSKLPTTNYIKVNPIAYQPSPVSLLYLPMSFALQFRKRKTFPLIYKQEQKQKLSHWLPVANRAKQPNTLVVFVHCSIMRRESLIESL